MIYCQHVHAPAITGIGMRVNCCSATISTTTVHVLYVRTRTRVRKYVNTYIYTGSTIYILRNGKK